MKSRMVTLATSMRRTRRIALASLLLTIGAERVGGIGPEEILAAVAIAEDIRVAVQMGKAGNRGGAVARAVNFADDDDRPPQAFH